MHHPSIDTLLGGTPENLRHLAQCADCRRMASLVSGSAPLAAGPREVPVVERSVFSSWEELPDARGGMGKLWRAFDQRLGRHVAIKQVRPGDEGEPRRGLLLRRLEREARITARLQHPAIVAIYEVGRFPDGELFYSMPLVAGRPLGKEIDARRTLALRLALLPQLTQVAEAIAYSHDKGVLHRDLKPDNILIGAFGEAVVIDWGLARELSAAEEDGAPEQAPGPPEPADGLTALGVGTPQYMAPEQARGEEPSPLLDIYGLGSTLYHLLCGEPPYGYESAREVLAALNRGPPQPIAAREPEAPVELVHICERAMSREPALRFASARELANELRRFLTGSLLQSRRYTRAELLAHFVRRHRTSLSVAAMALLLLVAVSAVGVVNIRRQRDRAEENEGRAEQSLRRAQGVLASKISTEAPRRLEAIALGLGAVGPELIGKAPGPPSPEAAQGLFDALAAGPAPLALRHPGAITDFAISPDGARLVGTGDDHTLALWDARSGRRLASFTSRLGMPHQVRFSPRGDRVAVCGAEPRAELHELAGGRRIEVSTAGNTTCAFMPDGAFITAAEALALRDPESGAVLKQLALPAPTARLAVSSGGRIAVAGKDGSLRVWTPRTGAVELLAASGAAAISLAFDRAGEQLALVRRDEGVHVWRSRGEGFVSSMEATESRARGYASRARFSPDGQLLYVPLWSEEEIATQVFAPDGGARVSSAAVFAQEWAGADRYLADAHGTFAVIDAWSGRAALALGGHSDEVKAAAWLGDGAASASREGEEFLWDLRAGVASGLLLGHTAEITAAVLDAAGTRLLTASFDGSVRIWPLPDGEPPLVFRGAGAVTSASWSPGGEGVLAGGRDGAVRFIDLRTQREAVLWRAGGPIAGARFLEDGQRALAGSLDGQLAILDLAGIKPPLLLTRAGDGAVTAVAVSPSGRELASAHAGGTVRVWDAALGKPLARHTNPDPDDDAVHTGLMSLDYAGPDQLLLGSPSGVTARADAHTLAALEQLPGRAASGDAHPLSPDGARFAGVSPDGRVLLHDLKGGEGRALPGHKGIVLATAFSRDGKLLATGGLDGSVRLFELASGRARMEQNSALGPVTAVALSADSQWVIAGYRSGALRLHPANAAAAVARACSILGRFEQLGELSVYCAGSPSAKSRNAIDER